MLKPLGDRTAVLLVDKVELAFLCRPTGSDQLVVNPFENEPRHSVLDPRFLVVIERL
jgi:hypothetical protein